MDDTPSPSESEQLSPSEDGLCPPSTTHWDTIPTSDQAQSPRVTVSMWGPGSDPGFTPLVDTMLYRPSINELAVGREIGGRNELVRGWLSDRFNDLLVHPESTGLETIQISDRPHDDTDEVPFGKRTQNSREYGQLYFNGTKETLSKEDYDLIASNRNWGNPPILYPISEGTHLESMRYQPSSSQAAIERYERMVRDTDSIVSRAPTCGTRRLSFCDVYDPQAAEEGSIAGNILRKVVRTKTKEHKPGGLLQDLRSLVRRPSASEFLQILKRGRAVSDDGETEGTEKSKSRKALESMVQPPTRMGSWGKKPVPSMNMALDLPITPYTTDGWGERTLHSINTAVSSTGNKTAPTGAPQSETESTNHTSIQSPKSTVGALTNFTPATSPKSGFRSLTANDRLHDRARKEEFAKSVSWGPKAAPLHHATTSQVTHLSNLPLVDPAKVNPFRLEDQGTGHRGTKGGDDGEVSDGSASNYQPSDFSGLEEDPLLRANFQNEARIPTVLDEPLPLISGAGDTPGSGKEDDKKDEAKTDLGASGNCYPPTLEQTTSTTCNAQYPVEDESLSSVLLDIPECEDEVMTASGLKPQCGMPIQKPAKSPRQVGLARVKIDIISLSTSLPSRQSDHEGSLSSRAKSETEESLQEDSGDQERPTSIPQFGLSRGSGTSSSASTGANANQPDDDVDGDGRSDAEGDRNKKPCRNTSKPTDKQNTHRFACPYQAFETSQSCFRPGPRNPNGGCAGIQRLKEMSATERFMHPDHETSLERASCSGSAEEIWWKIFQLLIPGMQDRSIETLKSEYWPYYMQLDSFMVPGMVFPNALFESEQPSVHATGIGLEGSDYITQNIQSPYLNMNPASFSNCTPASHTVYVPLLEASVGTPLQSGPQHLEFSTASQPGDLPLTLDSGPQTLTQATSTLQASETATQASQSASDQTQMRRNHERLRARQSRLQGEIDEIREANRAAATDLGRADTVIDDLLASENLPRHIEDRLSEVAQIIESVRKKLR